MIHFDWPWMILLLPLPLLVWYFSPRAERQHDAALRVPFLNELNLIGNNSFNHKPRLNLRAWLAVIAWLLLITAAMRPVWLGDFIDIPVSGRDLMLAIDLSGSMQEQDFEIDHHQVDRLTATKWVAGKFIDHRVGDRIGLILFGTQAYLQAPLTLDRKTVKTLLNEAVIGLAGKATAIGDAIGLAVKRLRKQPAKSRVLILMTDGANTAGAVDPIAAAELAKREGLKIYTIGIGADEMLLHSIFGTRRVNPSTDLDEKTLTRIAEVTGGKYFRARDTDSLEKIYGILDQLEPVEKDVRRYRPEQTLFYWPLAFALLFALLQYLPQLRLGEVR